MNCLLNKDKQTTSLLHRINHDRIRYSNILCSFRPQIWNCNAFFGSNCKNHFRTKQRNKKDQKEISEKTSEININEKFGQQKYDTAQGDYLFH
uniref:Uncharacterized protein n=1 Tax=Octopus bimaculoides TaxID=37653 RepID=A0A0L8GKT5_OCTBM